jgi:uncharacterized protein (DUF1800 family)
MEHPLTPLLKKDFDFAAALHLLNRAGFGGTPQQVQALVEMGLDGALDVLVEYDTSEPRKPGERSETEPPRDRGPLFANGEFRPDVLREPTPEEREALRRARTQGDEETIARLEAMRQQRERDDRAQLALMQKSWLQRMIETPRPLEEKLTLFWHGHFATGYRTIENSWHMALQNEMFRRYGSGEFQTLVRGIISDPAMLRYLDNNQNRRRSPNENLARELLELFTLGEGNGYSERDIKEGARALTGRTYRGNDFFFDKDQFDAGPKSILGKNGNLDGNAFVAAILERPECPQYIARKFYRFFVNDAPKLSRDGEECVARLAQEFRRNEGRIRPTLRTLFRSRHFYAPENRLAVIKSPTQLMVQTVRSLGTPPREMKSLIDAGDLMGQQLFQPPSVKGWDGGRAWINTATLFVRQNIVIYLVTGRRPQGFDWSESEMSYDSLPLVEHLRDARGGLETSEAMRVLASFALGGSVAPERLAQLEAFLDNLDSSGRATAITNDRIKALLCLIGAMPEYQLC